MINKVTLLGYLGADAEIRFTREGQPVATLSLATSRRWYTEGGDRQEQTEWHRVVCFGRKAEIARQYLVKGRLIYVEGRLRTTSWEDPETGQRRYRTDVVCEDFQMLGRGGEREGDGGGGEALEEAMPPEAGEGVEEEAEAVAM